MMDEQKKKIKEYIGSCQNGEFCNGKLKKNYCSHCMSYHFDGDDMVAAMKKMGSSNGDWYHFMCFIENNVEINTRQLVLWLFGNPTCFFDLMGKWLES